MEKFGIFRGNFQNPNPNQRWLTQPCQQKIDLTRPGSRIFDPGPSQEFGSIMGNEKQEVSGISGTILKNNT